MLNNPNKTVVKLDDKFACSTYRLEHLEGKLAYVDGYVSNTGNVLAVLVFDTGDIISCSISNIKKV